MISHLYFYDSMEICITSPKLDLELFLNMVRPTYQLRMTLNDLINK